MVLALTGGGGRHAFYVPAEVVKIYSSNTAIKGAPFRFDVRFLGNNQRTAGLSRRDIVPLFKGFAMVLNADKNPVYPEKKSAPDWNVRFGRKGKKEMEEKSARLHLESSRMSDLVNTEGNGAKDGGAKGTISEESSAEKAKLTPASSTKSDAADVEEAGAKEDVSKGRIAKKGISRGS